MSNRTLFEHQTRALSLIEQSYREGHRRIGLNAPTGSGKSFTMATMARGSVIKGNNVLITVPYVSLVDQMVGELRLEGLNHVGVMQGNHPLTNGLMPVQVGTLQTLARREIKQPGLVLVDEFHINSKFIEELMARWPNTLFVGFSATPGTNGLGRIWQDLVTPTTTQELIDTINPETGRSFLSPFKVYAADHPDLSGIKDVGGDYHEGQLADRMSNVKLIADAVETWKAKARGRPTMIFAVNRAHADKIHEQFSAAGVFAEYCDAFTSRQEREAIRQRMEKGETEVVVNIGTLTTGTNWPFISCIQICRPTKSAMLYKQIVGRGLRSLAGKDHCLVLDHSDNYQRHGFVTDVEWTRLDDGKASVSSKREVKDRPETHECLQCKFVMPAGTKCCPECGHEIKRISKIEFSQGELREKAGKAKAPSMQDKQRWYSMLLGHAQRRGIKLGWAYHKFHDKFGVYPSNQLHKTPIDPDTEVSGWITSRNIAWSKSRHNSANGKEVRS